MAGKYDPLRRFLAGFDGSEWSATFDQVELVLGFELPASAFRYPAWWANDVHHSQGRAWLEAGWETRGVDLYAESVVFVRAGGASRSQSGKRAPPRRREAVSPGISGPAPAGSDVLTLGGHAFVHTAAIEPERGPGGILVEFMPQSRYAHADTTPLNRYGQGPFCRFDIPGLPATSGVYVVTVDDALAYLGISVDLAQRWGPMGYANISPRNCFVGGQSTNCKVNHYILLAARDGRRVDLWIHEGPDPAPIETSLIRRLDPPWNGHRPRSPAVGGTPNASTASRSQGISSTQAAASESPKTEAAKGSGCLTAILVAGLPRLLRLLR